MAIIPIGGAHSLLRKLNAVFPSEMRMLSSAPAGFILGISLRRSHEMISSMTDGGNLSQKSRQVTANASAALLFNILRLSSDLYRERKFRAHPNNGRLRAPAE